jgi:hypothetical protein
LVGGTDLTVLDLFREHGAPPGSEQVWVSVNGSDVFATRDHAPVRIRREIATARAIAAPRNTVPRWMLANSWTDTSLIGGLIRTVSTGTGSTGPSPTRDD